MLLALLLLAVGTVLVAFGAESAVRGAATFALSTGIPAFALGALLFGVDFEVTAGAMVAVAGLGALFGGAWLLVAGGIRVLTRTGLAAGFVGAAIVATLASLDEILLEVLPIRRGHAELATGNLFGTMAAFTSLVPGL